MATWKTNDTNAAKTRQLQVKDTAKPWRKARKRHGKETAATLKQHCTHMDDLENRCNIDT